MGGPKARRTTTFFAHHHHHERHHRKKHHRWFSVLLILSKSDNQTPYKNWHTKESDSTGFDSHLHVNPWLVLSYKEERFKETGHFQDLWLCCLFNQWKLSFFNWYHIYGHMIVDKFSYYLGFNLDKNYNSVVFILIRNEWLFFVFLYVKLRILVKNGWDFWKKFKLS